MKINKVKSIVRRMARNYSNYDEIINGLKEKKETGAKKDVNCGYAYNMSFFML